MFLRAKAELFLVHTKIEDLRKDASTATSPNPTLITWYENTFVAKRKDPV